MKQQRIGMKITQLECDWKDNFTGKELNKAGKSVGGKAIFYDYDQGEVDAKVMFVSSHDLSQSQLDELWNEGDLYTGDKIWSGKNFKEILTKIKKYRDETVAEEEVKYGKS